ncbi:MAG: helix-turn-helix transcriptional regulator, partial [Nitrospinae bacterium]|nr:helix-turn-helix transcriptional regulator [Nitrospinota bacterium]
MTDNRISERLAEIRALVGFSQAEFAAKLGISQAHISDLESGRRKPPQPLRIAICYKFAINIKWLEDGDGERIAKTLDPDTQNMGDSKPSEQ